MSDLKDRLEHLKRAESAAAAEVDRLVSGKLQYWDNKLAEVTAALVEVQRGRDAFVAQLDAARAVHAAAAKRLVEVGGQIRAAGAEIKSAIDNALVGAHELVRSANATLAK